LYDLGNAELIRPIPCFRFVASFINTVLFVFAQGTSITSSNRGSHHLKAWRCVAENFYRLLTAAATCDISSPDDTVRYAVSNVCNGFDLAYVWMVRRPHKAGAFVR
jgi:hypothetical protein